ncbi:LacI family DNA-binding transcriptional regulator [Candidatus Sumerlaeota bacterium]|nr:LacI family DNA-binding transcriptional regulator [Candidatus Sumerlaeota bacterium]
MKPTFLAIIAAVALACGASAAMAQPEQIIPPAETHYNSGPQPINPGARNPGKRPPPAAVYGSEGIYTDSPWGIVSTRRTDPAFVGIMQGIQEAAKQATQKEINVAPMSKEALDDQISDLTAHNAKSIIIDAPRPDDVARIIANAKFLKINVVVVSEIAPQGGLKGAPLIVTAPTEYAVAGAGAAIDALKEQGKGRIVFLASGFWEDDLRQKFLEQFTDKKQYEVIEAKEDTPIAETGVPTVFVALTPADTSKIPPYMIDVSDAKVVGTGDTVGVKFLYDEGRINYLLRTDAARIFSECQRLVGNPVGEPVIVKPLVEKSTKTPAPPGAPPMN